MPSVFVVLVLAAAGGSGILMSDRKKLYLRHWTGLVPIVLSTTFIISFLVRCKVPKGHQSIELEKQL